MTIHRRERGRSVLRPASRRINRWLARLEAWTGDGGTRPLPQVPILILGAPRCGSTLVYQLLIQRFGFGYLSNLHCRLYGAPSLVEWPLRFARALGLRQRPTDYRSAFGRTAGLLGPSECGIFWYRFFRRHTPLSAPAEAPEAAAGLRAAVRSLGVAAGRPLVFKNLYSSVRVRSLAELFPEALFVVCRRDEVANAESLLAARLASHGDVERWFSVETPDIESLRDRPAHVQVVEQVRRIYARIADDRDGVGGDRFFELELEAVARDAHGELAKLERFFLRHGVALPSRGAVPASFSTRREARIAPELHQKVVEYAQQTAR